MFHGLVQVESKERRVAHRQTAPQLPPDEGRRRLNPFQGTLLRGCIAHHAEEDECAAQVAGGVYLGNGYYSPKSGVLDLAEDYLTDFLARQFDAFVWKPLGLDRHPELIEMYFGNYTKLVYQSQIEDPALLARAQSCADRLGLEFEHRRTGFGELESSLRNWVSSPR